MTVDAHFSAFLALYGEIRRRLAEYFLNDVARLKKWLPVIVLW